MEYLSKLLLIFLIGFSSPWSWADSLPDNAPVADTQGVTQAESAPDSAVEANPVAVNPSAAPKAVGEKVAHDLSPYGMYQAADWVVKVVMLLLLGASGVIWAIGVAKQIQLSVACRRARNMLNELLESETLIEGKLRCDNAKGAGVLLLAATQQELDLSARAERDEGLKERLQLRLDRVQSGLSRSMAAGTGVLATVGSVGPFVGLFGTVWGIMNAFVGIAKSQSTSLAVVAPGIAEALLATAIGLVAAIPAVVLFNHFTRGVSQYRALMTDVSAALMVLVSRDLDRDPVCSKEVKQAA